MEMEFKHEPKPFTLAKIFVLPRCFASNPEPYHCKRKRCNLKTDFKVILSYHKRVVHKKRKVNYDLVRILEKLYCDKCEFDTCSVLLLMKHKIDNHVDTEQRSRTQWFKCGECKYQTGIKSDLDAHTLAKHTYPEADDWFACAQCDYKSRYKNSLQIHLAMMNHQNPGASRFECEQCSVATKTERLLRAHVLRKHPTSARVVWYTCEQCPYRAKNKRTLGLHMFNKHTAIDNIRYTTINKVKWFKCEQCAFKSKYESAVKAHTTKHDDQVDWFRCGECTFRTKWKYSLTNHIRNKHTDRDVGDAKALTSLECEHCVYVARWPSHLIRHMLKHKRENMNC